jgi:hypothetical protein
MTELQGKESGAANAIFSTQTAGDAGAAIVNKFLRPNESSRASREARYTEGQPAQPSGGGNLAELMQAAANPFLAPEMRAQINNMIQQAQGQEQAAQARQFKREDSAYDRQMDQQDPMYQQNLQLGQIQLDQARNPQPGFTIVTPQEVQSLGLPPGAYQRGADGKIAQIGGGGVTVNNDMGGGSPGLGKLSTDFGYVLDPATGQPKIDPTTGLPTAAAVPGSPAALDAAKIAASRGVKAGNASIASDTVTTAASRARVAAGQRNFGGLGANIVGAINPYSDSAEVMRQVDVLKSNAKIGNLQAMRDASPTGGALGAVTAPELQMLADQSGALDPRSPNFLRDLDDYERNLLRTIHGPTEGDAVFEQTRSSDTGGTPAMVPQFEDDAVYLRSLGLE